MTTTNSPDWPEDFELENGSYNNQCTKCNRVFTGLKGRKNCKICVGEFENAMQMLPMPHIPKENPPTFEQATGQNPAKLLQDFFKSQKFFAHQRAEQRYVDAVVGTPMNRKQRRAADRGVKGKRK